MPQTVVAHQETHVVRALLIALLVTVLVLGALALITAVWPESGEKPAVSSAAWTGFGAYAAGSAPVMGDRHFMPSSSFMPSVTAGFGAYEAGTPPVMHDPEARLFG